MVCEEEHDLLSDQEINYDSEVEDRADIFKNISPMSEVLVRREY